MKEPSAEDATQPAAPAGFEIRKMIPRVINVDKNAAYPKAIAALKAAGSLPDHVELRQVKYLNNLVEQEGPSFHQTIDQAWNGFLFLTLQGYEGMNMIRKGQMQGVGKGDIVSQRDFIARLFGVVG